MMMVIKNNFPSLLGQILELYPEKDKIEATIRMVNGTIKR